MRARKKKIWDWRAGVSEAPLIESKSSVRVVKGLHDIGERCTGRRGPSYVHERLVIETNGEGHQICILSIF